MITNFTPLALQLRHIIEQQQHSAASHVARTLSCWHGELGHANGKLLNQCTGHESGGHWDENLQPQILLMRTGDCLGLRTAPPNKEGGSSSEEGFEKLEALLVKVYRSNPELEYAGEDQLRYDCEVVSAGCICQLLIEAYDMSPKGCDCWCAGCVSSCLCILRGANIAVVRGWRCARVQASRL
jgi:hypothetical protein